MDRLLRSAFLLDYTLAAMNVLMPMDAGAVSGALAGAAAAVDANGDVDMADGGVGGEASDDEEAELERLALLAKAAAFKVRLGRNPHTEVATPTVAPGVQCGLCVLRPCAACLAICVCQPSTPPMACSLLARTLIGLQPFAIPPAHVRGLVPSLVLTLRPRCCRPAPTGPNGCPRRHQRRL